MSKTRDWIYDEFRQVGTDYSQEATAGGYDNQMKEFRDYDLEAKSMIDKLGIPNPKDLVAADLGCGTGAFSIHAAKYLKKIYAVDVSDEMLNIAKSKAQEFKIANIEFCKSGFLQFRLEEKIDLVLSKWAFHHLPDFWKQAALLNINKSLKKGGLFVLTDWVFTFEADYEDKIDSLLSSLSKDFDEAFIKECEIHIRDEYSTYDWILRGMIERAGFTIEKSDASDPLASEYFCRKTKCF